MILLTLDDWAEGARPWFLQIDAKRPDLSDLQMRYDIDLICQMCRETGLSARRQSDRRVDIDLGGGAVLSLQNEETEDDCLVGFLGTPWHAHGDIMFAGHGTSVELDCLDIVVGLKEGKILICERQVGGQTLDRWLIHSKYNDEFEYLEEGEQIVIRRAAAQQSVSIRSAS